MAEKVKKTGKKKTGKKREKVNVPVGIAHILASFNNTVISHNGHGREPARFVQRRRGRFQGIAQGDPVRSAAGGLQRGKLRQRVRDAHGPGSAQRTGCRARVGCPGTSGGRPGGEIDQGRNPDPPQWMPSSQEKKGLAARRFAAASAGL